MSSLQQRISSIVRAHGPQSYGRRQQTSGRNTIPASIRGWNARDGLASMKDDYAITMRNYFPELGRARLRRGYNTFVEGLGGAVETLFAHVSGTVDKLIACANGNIWDTNTATPTSLASGFTSNRWQTASFNGHTIMVNGEDAPARVLPDGTVTTTHGWTAASGGPTLDPANLVSVMPFKQRLFFVEKDTARLWYGPVASIQGELTSFNLGLVVPEGGNLMAIGTLTLDSGFGVDDLFVAFFDSGAVAVYQGTDIADSNRWGLVGIFRIGNVIGRRPLLKFGGDLIAITTDGYVPVRSLLGTERERKGLALSDAISPAVSEAARNVGTAFGWQPMLHTPANWLMVNVPAATATVQHVMNTQTGAWCEFTGWPAHCWGRWKDRLFWGGADGKVYEANVGLSDGGGNIEGDIQSAYKYFKGSDDKRFTMIRPIIESDGGASYAVGTSTDFAPVAPLEAPGSIAESRQAWADLTWADWSWGPPGRFTKAWRTINRTGAALSVRLRTSTRGVRVSLYATDVQYTMLSGIGS